MPLPIPPEPTAAIRAYIDIQTQAYLGEVCYRAFLADEKGPLYLMLAGKKQLPCAQWDGSSGWDAGVGLPGGQVELLREVGRFAEPAQALQVGHKNALNRWGTGDDQRWYGRPDHWAHPESIRRTEVRWPVLLDIEGEFEQPALIALLRQRLQSLQQIERRLICQLQLSLRRPRNGEHLLLVRRAAIPIEQVRWELEDLIRAIQTRLGSNHLRLQAEVRDITAQPNVLNLLMGSL